MDDRPPPRDQSNLPPSEGTTPPPAGDAPLSPTPSPGGPPPPDWSTSPTATYQAVPPPPPPSPGDPPAAGGPPPPTWSTIGSASHEEPPPPDNTRRNAVIAAVVVGALLLLLLFFLFGNRGGPAATSSPGVSPSASASASTIASASAPPSPSAEPTATSEATPTAEVTAAPTLEITAPPTAEITAAPTVEVTVAPTAEVTAAPTEPVALPSLFPSAEPEQGILFTTPEMFGTPELPTIGILAQNTSDLVKSYTVKATYLSGETITATATGVVNDHIPGQIRPVTLLLDGAPGPEDEVTVDIDTMLSEDETTPNAEIAKLIVFGPPTFSDGILQTIDVQVTNNSDALVSLSVSAGVIRDGILVGIGTGFVNDLAAGQTKTATLLMDGDGTAEDQVLFAVDSVLIP